MPLTIEQALQEIPVLNQARVVAGWKNLGQAIRWTHIIDHPDMVPWVGEGYLLLTTAFALMLNPETQLDLIPRLGEKKLAGMMVNIGRYMGEIPSGMVEAAQAIDFPLIALPWEVDFTEVTRAIHERIINEQYALSEQVAHIHEVLTQIVIAGGGLDTLAARLAELLQRSITIEDVSFSLLAYYSIEPVDQVRQRSIAEKRTPPEVVAYHTAQGLYERLRQMPRPQKVDPVLEIGLTLERVIAPIMVGSHLLGYIWVIATDHPLTELDFQVIERAANVAALILSREQAVYEAEQRVKTQLFDRLLDSQQAAASHDLYETFEKLGLSDGYQVMIMESRLPGELGVPYRYVENFLFDQKQLALVLERSGRLVVVLGSSSNERGMEWANQLREWDSVVGANLSIGISSPAKQIGQVRTAYEQALSALLSGQALGGEAASCWSYQDLGYLTALLELPREAGKLNRYTTAIATLAAYDEKHSTHLLRTLEIYIQHLSNIQQAAKRLYIHRNTLYQRLEKICELCQVDLEDILVVVNLFLALQDWKLQKGKSPD